MSRQPEEGRPRDEEPPTGSDKEFHPWRLLGVILGVVAVLAVIAAIVDVVVLGL